MSTLTPREERVLRMRFGVGMNTDCIRGSQTTIFSDWERIRQIEAKIRKLKHPSRSKQLKVSWQAASRIAEYCIDIAVVEQPIRTTIKKFQLFNILIFLVL